MEATQKFAEAQHAIQLNFVALRELHFDSSKVPSLIAESEYGSSELTMSRANYDEQAKTIQVRLKCEMKGAEGAFCLRVELVGQFLVDESEFPKEKVHLWADKAAVYILFPFLREHVYALSIRSGLKPLILPLMHLPTFKVEKTATVPERPEMAHS